MKKIQYKEIKFKSMGTNIHIKLLHKDAEAILKKCRAMIDSWAFDYSIFEKQSILSKINRLKCGQNIKLQNDIFDLIEAGLNYSKALPNINICLGELIKLWDIGPGYGKLVSSKHIAKALTSANIDNIVLDRSNSSLNKLYSETKIDLGSLAKGYFSQMLSQFMTHEGVSSAIINLGGNIQTIGLNLENPSLDWTIMLKNPNFDSDESLLSLALNDLSISTSGIKYRNFKKDNKFYHHILDPKTGYPIDTDMVSLSIIGPNPLECEALSTGLFGLSWHEIDDFLITKKNYHAIAIYKNSNTKCTRGADKYILWKR